MTRALLFDYDGLIVDSETILGRALIDVLASDGVEVTFDDFGHLLGTTGPDNDRAWDELIRSYLGDDVDVQLLEERLRAITEPAMARIEPLPGVRELIGAARSAGWATGLGTGNTGAFETHLERVGLGDAFDSIVRTHGSSLASKPAPDVFLVLAEQLGVAPQRCIVLEDSVFGCQAAIAAGMAVVACPSTATRSCAFPELAHRVETLLDVDLDLLSRLLPATAR